MRYLIFKYDTYYPGGGGNDYFGAASSIEEAVTMLIKPGDSWYEQYNIFDCEQKTVVSKGFIKDLCEQVADKTEESANDYRDATPKCKDCGTKEEVTYAPCPYGSEIHGDNTEYFMCKNCRASAAADI